MRAQEFITEVFDKPYKGHWEKSDYGRDLLVKLPDGSNLSVMFNLDHGAYGDEEWSVEFWRNNSQDVTGAGDQQRIFATVLSAIKKFIDNEHPERIRFTANKDVIPGQKSSSRTNLYNRLVQRYANSWGYDVDIDDFADTTVYNLHTMNEGIVDDQLDEISRDRLERYLDRANRQVDSRQERMARARARLNTSYEIYHADNPSKIVDRFEADTPALAQKYYQDYIERYESDVDYDLRLRRGTGIMEGLYDANPATYDLPRRSLNVPELIKRGAIFITEPHGDNGWEPDAEGFSLITLYNVAKGGWPTEAKQHLKPSMYHVAATGLNRQGPGTMLYDGKYRQILWSIKKLGIPDEVAFLDGQLDENFADGKNPGRKGLAKRMGVNCKLPVSKLRSIAKNSSGERARMAHWCANMKSGKKKK